MAERKYNSLFDSVKRGEDAFVKLNRKFEPEQEPEEPTTFEKLFQPGSPKVKAWRRKQSMAPRYAQQFTEFSMKGIEPEPLPPQNQEEFIARNRPDWPSYPEPLIPAKQQDPTGTLFKAVTTPFSIPRVTNDASILDMVGNVAEVGLAVPPLSPEFAAINASAKAASAYARANAPKVAGRISQVARELPKGEVGAIRLGGEGAEDAAKAASGAAKEGQGVASAGVEAIPGRLGILQLKKGDNVAFEGMRGTFRGVIDSWKERLTSVRTNLNGKSLPDYDVKVRTPDGTMYEVTADRLRPASMSEYEYDKLGIKQPPTVKAAGVKPEVKPAPVDVPPQTPVKTATGAPPEPPPPVKPPTATASPQPPEDFAANIRLSKYPEEVRPLLKEWADANPEVIANARRGVRTDAQVLEDAQALVADVGGDFRRMQKRWKTGDAWNAEEILALRGTLRSKTEEVLAAQKAVKAANSTENLLKLEIALQEQAAVQKTVSGVTAEAGRGLRQFRQQVFDASNDVNKLERLLKQVGGRDKIEDLAKLFEKLDIDNPASVNAFIRSTQKPGFWDYITEIYYNSILSGPKTHIVNSLSNTANAFVSPIERAAGAAVEAPLALLQRRARARFFNEVPADAFGAIEGMKEGFRAFGKTMKSGVSPEQASKFEMQRTRAFTGKIGRVINTPSTSLEAADAMMQAVNYRAAFNATAKRMVARSGKKGDEALELLAELKTNPPKNLIEEANRIAEQRLFRQEAGKTTQTIINLRDTVAVGGFKPLRYIIPFVRTPANLLKYGLERSPAGWLNPKLWANIAAKNPEAADQIGRAALGSMAAAVIAWYTLEGNITGAAPTNTAERDRFYRDGKQPFSIRIGDKWVSYQRLEPFNQTFAQVAAVVEALKNKDKDAGAQATQAVNTIAQNMVSQTYLSGLSNVIDGIAQPERYAGNIATRFATALATPASSLTRTAAQVIDPTVRDPQNLGDEFKVGVPGLSKQVPSKITAFGQDVVRKSPAWLPINITPSQETPITRELDRLSINTGFVGKTVSGVPLTTEEQRTYQIAAGQATEKAITQLINSASYQKLNDQDREKKIDAAVNDARDAARTFVLKSIPSAEQAYRKKNGLPGISAAQGGETFTPPDYTPKSPSIPNIPSLNSPSRLSTKPKRKLLIPVR